MGKWEGVMNLDPFTCTETSSFCLCVDIKGDGNLNQGAFVPDWSWPALNKVTCPLLTTTLVPPGYEQGNCIDVSTFQYRAYALISWVPLYFHLPLIQRPVLFFNLITRAYFLPCFNHCPVSFLLLPFHDWFFAQLSSPEQRAIITHPWQSFRASATQRKCGC